MARDVGGCEVAAVLMGEDAGGQASVLAGSGADKVFLADDPRLSPYRNDAHGAVLAKLIAREDPEVVLFPSQRKPDVTAGLTELTAGDASAGPRVRLRTRTVQDLAIIEVAGRLDDVVEELNRAIQLALAQEPRGVVCDLTAVFEGAGPAAVSGAGPAAVEVLASAGRHVRDWPGVPVAVACPDELVREALRAHPLGRHLIVTESLLPAVTAVLATHTLTIERLRLAPHRSAQDAAQEFVTRTLLGWRLTSVIPFATLVVSELVASSTMDSGADIDVSVVWNLGALRVTVRDDGPELPRQPYAHLDPHGRRLSVVAVLSRAFGVLPTADGGKVVWAVLKAPRDTWERNAT